MILTIEPGANPENLPETRRETAVAGRSLLRQQKAENEHPREGNEIPAGLPIPIAAGRRRHPKQPVNTYKRKKKNKRCRSPVGKVETAGKQKDFAAACRCCCSPGTHRKDAV